MNTLNCRLVLLTILSFPGWICSQSLPDPIAQYEIWPIYALPGKAEQIPGNYIAPPQSRFEAFKAKHAGFVFHDMEADEVIQNVLEAPFSTNAFTFEMLLLHHVNTMTGAAIYLLDEQSNQPVYWQSYYSTYREEEGALINSQLGDNIIETRTPPFNKYWFHLIGTYQNDQLSLYVNGELSDQINVTDISIANLRLDMAAYVSEPYLHLGDVIKEVKVYDQALDASQVKQSLYLIEEKIKQGGKYRDLFHFNAGPYLHLTTQTSANILWETNVPASAIVYYGKKLPLTDSMIIEQTNPSESGYEAFIQELTISDLEPHTKYFYNIKLNSDTGEEMESGVLSFQTAVKEESSFQFAAIGDTEARPHVNDQIAKLIWGERPDFVLHMGDLTDGGRKDSKWEWNYEYFQGMTQLHSRIPVFPVPGNGEGDLYWYEKYHRLGEEEAFYSFPYGNAEFFMLNSNERKTEFAEGGKQYTWLDERLAASNAKWTFVCMHHAPYSTDEDDYGNSYEGLEDYGDLAVKQLVPLFEKHGVDIVFFGHLHTYSRMGPIKAEQIDQENGVYYIQTGGAGGNLEDFGPTRAWFSEKVYRGHHYCLVNIHQGSLVFKMYDAEGRLRDMMELEKD